MAEDASSIITSNTNNTSNDDNNNHDPNNNNTGLLPFYPAFCFPASPTHFTWVKLSIADIHRLRTKEGFEGQNIYFYYNHPIQFVSLAGVVVTREEYERRTVLVVDDSSGANIEVIILKGKTETTGGGGGDNDNDNNNNNNGGNNANAEKLVVNITSTARTPIDITEIQIGTVVKIKGTLSTFRASMQVILERFWILPDTNAEVKFWNERSRFLVDVLSVPWTLTPEDIEALRKRAEEEEIDVAKQRRKIMERQRRLEEREKKDYRRIMKRWEKEERLREKEAEWIRESNRRFEERLAKRRDYMKSNQKT